MIRGLNIAALVGAGLWTVMASLSPQYLENETRPTSLVALAGIALALGLFAKVMGLYGRHTMFPWFSLTWFAIAGTGFVVAKHFLGYVPVEPQTGLALILDRFIWFGWPTIDLLTIVLGRD